MAVYEVSDHEIASRFLDAVGADDGTETSEATLAAWLEQTATALSEAVVAARYPTAREMAEAASFRIAARDPGRIAAIIKRSIRPAELTAEDIAAIDVRNGDWAKARSRYIHDNQQSRGILDAIN